MRKTRSRQQKSSSNSRLRKLASGRRSKLEERQEARLLEIGPVEYEPDKIPFIQPAVERYYLPDYKLADKTYVEVKGRLTLEDRKKLIWVKEQNPDITIHLIFGRASNTLTKRSKTTYRDWATQHGFECIDESEPVPKRWFNRLETLSSKKRKLG